MNQEQKNTYMKYRELVREILDKSQNYIKKELLFEAHDYYDHGEHALALNSLLYVIVDSVKSIDYLLVDMILTCINEFWPDWDYLSYEIVENFMGKLNNSEVIFR